MHNIIMLSTPKLVLRCQCAGNFCRDLSTREVVFASIAGLRGSISLIMAQAFVTESAAASADAQVGSCPATAWSQSAKLQTALLAVLLPPFSLVTEVTCVLRALIALMQNQLGSESDQQTHGRKDDHSSDSCFLLGGLAHNKAVICCSMQMIKAELVLWVAGFVLLSLIVNAPMLPWLLRILRLNVGKLLGLGAAPCNASYATPVRMF